MPSVCMIGLLSKSYDCKDSYTSKSNALSWHRCVALIGVEKSDA